MRRCSLCIPEESVKAALSPPCFYHPTACNCQLSGRFAEFCSISQQSTVSSSGSCVSHQLWQANMFIFMDIRVLQETFVQERTTFREKSGIYKQKKNKKATEEVGWESVYRSWGNSGEFLFKRIEVCHWPLEQWALFVQKHWLVLHRSRGCFFRIGIRYFAKVRTRQKKVPCESYLVNSHSKESNWNLESRKIILGRFIISDYVDGKAWMEEWKEEFYKDILHSAKNNRHSLL